MTEYQISDMGVDYQVGDTLVVPGRGIFTFRSMEEIVELIKQREAHYTAGEKKEGDKVRHTLSYTALLPTPAKQLGGHDAK